MKFYKEILKNSKQGKDILSGKAITFGEELNMGPTESLVIELYRVLHTESSFLQISLADSWQTPVSYTHLTEIMHVIDAYLDIQKRYPNDYLSAAKLGNIYVAGHQLSLIHILPTASKNKLQVKYSFSCSIFKIVANRKAKSGPSGRKGFIAVSYTHLHGAPARRGVLR